MTSFIAFKNNTASHRAQIVPELCANFPVVLVSLCALSCNSPLLLHQPSDNATGDTLVLVVWHPYLNFMMQSIIRKHRKIIPPCYLCVSGAKFKAAFLVCPQLISEMSLLSFDIGAESILICNEQEKIQKLLSTTYKWCPKIANKG